MDSQLLSKQLQDQDRPSIDEITPQRRWQLKQKEQGNCIVCGMSREGSQNACYCLKCKIQTNLVSKLRKRRQAEEFKKFGLCIRCKKKTEEYAICFKCREKRKIWYQNKKEILEIKDKIL